jgi:hypothetical protein
LRKLGKISYLVLIFEKRVKTFKILGNLAENPLRSVWFEREKKKKKIEINRVRGCSATFLLKTLGE